MLNLTPNSIPTLEGAIAGAKQGLPTTADGLYSSALVDLAEGGTETINIPVTPAAQE